MKNFIVHLILFCSFPLISKAQQDSEYVPHYRPFFSDSSYSVITMERDTVGGYEVLKETDKTQSYHIVNLWVGEESRPMLIPETSIQTFITSADGSQGSIMLSGKVSDGGSFNKTIWNKTITANETNYLYDYLEARYIGCCAAVDTKELLRYSDGARLLLLSSDLGSVSIPNNRSKRYIGYLSSSAMMGYDEINDPLLCGVLTYMDPESLKSQSLVIAFKDSAATDSLGFDIFEKMTLIPADPKDKKNYFGGAELDLWSGEGKPDAIGYTGFTIDLHMFSNKIILRIPVKNDKIDIVKIKSKWFTVSLR